MSGPLHDLEGCSFARNISFVFSPPKLGTPFRTRRDGEMCLNKQEIYFVQGLVSGPGAEVGVRLHKTLSAVS